MRMRSSSRLRCIRPSFLQTLSSRWAYSEQPLLEPPSLCPPPNQGDAASLDGTRKARRPRTDSPQVAALENSDRHRISSGRFSVEALLPVQGLYSSCPESRSMKRTRFGLLCWSLVFVPLCLRWRYVCPQTWGASRKNASARALLRPGQYAPHRRFHGRDRHVLARN